MAHNNLDDLDDDPISILENAKGRLLKKAIAEAENGNTLILGKLLDKILPNLNKMENLNVNINATSNIIENVIKNIGIIDSLESKQIQLNDGGKMIEEGRHPEADDGS